MANTGFQTILDALAFVVGGTQDTDSTAPANFYSGYRAGDGTGIQGLMSVVSPPQVAGPPVLLGCYSSPPPSITDTPVAVLLPRKFEALLGSAIEEHTDDIALKILVAKVDTTYAVPNASIYRDLVPQQLSQHMTLKDAQGTPVGNIIQGFAVAGEFGGFDWAGVPYIGWEFTVRVRRLIPRVFAA